MEPSSPSPTSPAAASAKMHLVFKPFSIIFGAVAGIAWLILLQQYGVTTVTTGKLILALILGALILGVGLATLGGMIAARKSAGRPGGDA